MSLLIHQAFKDQERRRKIRDLESKFPNIPLNFKKIIGDD